MQLYDELKARGLIAQAYFGQVETENDHRQSSIGVRNVADRAGDDRGQCRLSHKQDETDHHRNENRVDEHHFQIDGFLFA